MDEKENQDQAAQWMKHFIDSAVEFYQEIKQEPAFTEPNPETLLKLQNMKIPEHGRPAAEVLEEMATEIYQKAGGTRVQHPRCFSCIPSPVSVYSWMGDLLTSVYDPHAGCWMNAPGAACIEEKLIRWMCGLAGYPEKAGGIFLSGGSMANLTALTAARDNRLTPENRSLGIAYVSRQTHSSVAKALHIIGFAPEQIRSIETDDQFRMDLQALTRAIQEDRQWGRIPFAVIATAGTTNTGSIDPLEEIGEICRKNRLWMHVDGAFGASLLLSPTQRSLLKGIELSHSISWDAHKWMRQTYGCSMVLVRDASFLSRAFSAHPEYLKDAEVHNPAENYWDLGPELTRPARALKLWLTLQITGTKAMGEMIDHGCAMARFAESLLQKNPQWEIVSPARQGILNFRLAPAGYPESCLDQLNQQLAQAINASGYAQILTTTLQGKNVLRMCIPHPETSPQDIQSVVSFLEKAGEALCRKTDARRKAS